MGLAPPLASTWSDFLLFPSAAFEGGQGAEGHHGLGDDDGIEDARFAQVHLDGQ